MVYDQRGDPQAIAWMKDRLRNRGDRISYKKRAIDPVALEAVRDLLSSGDWIHREEIERTLQPYRISLITVSDFLSLAEDDTGLFYAIPTDQTPITSPAERQRPKRKYTPRRKLHHTSQNRF